MADLTVAELEAAVALSHPDTNNGKAIRDLVAEVKRRRKEVEQDLRLWQGRVAEVGSLKRRITELRRGLRHIDSTDGEASGNTARSYLDEDHDRRHRFEAKQRKAARRG